MDVRDRTDASVHAFQSPFNRDSSCNGTSNDGMIDTCSIFQSPFNRDSSCNRAAAHPYTVDAGRSHQAAFSPLLIGIAVVTSTFFAHWTICCAFSPLLIGIAVVTNPYAQDQVSACFRTKITSFQSPFNRDSSCNYTCPVLMTLFHVAFSPLLIGIAVVTLTWAPENARFLSIFQSPFNRDSSCNST